ncbi:hypothetical protein DM02DRAFT_199662 [Periconia macrospinosa]|uniref:Uncharacterized protein n=1 Tax=Periconia macrospinosa TaxID=97972 RepID=A0A2V1D7U2_9PLEO|nr:hypothetical protein DM02DRAFT_199662 [Periconia macrospinosa]
MVDGPVLSARGPAENPAPADAAQRSADCSIKDENVPPSLFLFSTRPCPALPCPALPYLALPCTASKHDLHYLQTKHLFCPSSSDIHLQSSFSPSFSPFHPAAPTRRRCPPVTPDDQQTQEGIDLESQRRDDKPRDSSRPPASSPDQSRQEEEEEKEKEEEGEQ